MTGTEVERVERRRPALARQLRRRQGDRRPSQHPDADRLRVCTVDIGDGERDDRLRRPQRRRRPDRRRGAARGADAGRREAAQGEAARGRLGRDDPLRRRARDRRGPRRHPGPRRRARRRHAAGRGAAAGRAGAGDRGDAEPGRLLRRLRASPARSTRSPAAPLGARALGRGRAPPRARARSTDFASVAVEVPELCPRFTARVFTDVKIGPSPLWLQARLTAAGQRPINNVVDITNYVMLLTAQPLHAFDLDKVPGGALTVRAARRGREDDDARRRRARASTPRRCWSATATGRPGSPGSWAARSPRSPRRRPGCCSRSPTGTAPTSCAPRACSGCARRPPRASRSSCTRTSAMRAQAIASRLLVELCGAKLVPGTIDVAAAGPAAPRLRLRAARVEGLLGMRIDAGRPGRLPGAARLRRRGRRRRPRGHGPARPPLRRHPRGRPDRGGRPGPRLRRAPADDAAGGRRQGRRPQPRAAAAPAGRGRLRDLGFDQVVGWSFTDPGEAGRLRIPAERPARRRGPARQPALRGPVGDADDAARLAARRRLPQPRPRGRRRRPLRVRPGLPAAGTPSGTASAGGRSSPASSRRPFAEPHRLGGLAVGPLVAEVLAGRRRARRLLRAQGRARGAGRAARRRARLRGRARAVPAPGTVGARSRSPASPVGWIGEVHPLVCREWDLARRGRLRNRRRAAARRPPPPARRATRTSPPSPPSARTSPSSSRPRSPPIAVRDAVLAGGGELLRSADVFDLFEGEQLGEGRKSLALRLEFRAADRTLTDEEVAALREAIKAKLEQIGGSLRE